MTSLKSIYLTDAQHGVTYRLEAQRRRCTTICVPRLTAVVQRSQLKITTKFKVEGIPLVIVVREKTTAFLRAKNFRGSHVHCAGNFSLWESYELFLDDLEVQETLFDDVREALELEQCERTFDIDWNEIVGWTSTIPLESYDESALESFRPNAKSFALRIKKSRRDIQAPKTTHFTVSYELKREVDWVTHLEQYTVVIFSIHTGQNIGTLEGHKSKPPDGVLFFDWNHPGED